jgi:hypothetical protein
MPGGLDSDQSALSQIAFRLPQSIHDMLEQRFGQEFLRPYLHDARSIPF